MHNQFLIILQNGIAGPFWYAVGVMTNIFIFPIFSVEFKTRAPGAKTYLQVNLWTYSVHFTMLLCKIEKVSMGIQGEKSNKDMASSRNLVSTIGA